MIHEINYQSEELLKQDFFKLRKLVNPETDIIYLKVLHNKHSAASNKEIYNKVLRLEGAFRTETNNWTCSPAKVRVINTMQ